jgi:hypothetical protein
VTKLERRPLTGAPAPRPAWQVICEFANGSCICASIETSIPCASVALAEQAVRERMMFEARGERMNGRPKR